MLFNFGIQVEKALILKQKSWYATALMRERFSCQPQRKCYHSQIRRAG